MATVWKKSVAFLVAAVVALGMMGVVPGTAPEAHAASKPHMKAIKVKWDLKKNKTVKLKTAWPGFDYQDMKITIKNYKVKKAKKKGYKQVSFTVVQTQNFAPTKKMMNAASKFEYVPSTLWGCWNTAVVDYSTGKCLEAKNNKHVTVKYGKVKRTGVKKYTSKSGFWLKIPKRATQKVTITYPASYKGLCFGVFGESDILGGDMLAKNLFWKGKRAFGKTPYYDSDLAEGYIGGFYDSDGNLIDGITYPKSKSNSHWMRIK